MKKLDENKKKQLISIGFAALLALAAFLAALAFRRSSGIVAMTPLAFFITAAAAFLPIDEKTKTLFFGVTAFCLNTVNEQKMKYTVIYTAIITVSCFIFSMGAKYIVQKKKKAVGIPLIAVCLVACTVLGLVYMGNPVAAAKAKSEINEYTQGIYPNDENAALGKVEFTDIQYNYADGTYFVYAQSSVYPSDTQLISIKDGGLTDLFKPLMEKKITEPYAKTFTAALRKSFPDDTFWVNCDSVALLPDERLLAAEAGEFYDDITYKIWLGGIQNNTDMTEAVIRYMKVIEKQKLPYDRIVFTGGSNPWIVRSVTVENITYVDNDNYSVDFVSTAISNRLNRFVNYWMKIKK